MTFPLGVEEELFLVDAETLEPAPVFSRVVPEPGERIKPELFECLVEITTPICRDADEVLTRLVALRREVADRAARHGATILAAGMHPTGRGDGQPIVPEPRYRELAANLGAGVSRQLVCGLHVHVGVGDWSLGSRAFTGLVRWLPAILALSVNSPYDEGRESGLLSVRAGRLTELPTGGVPPADLPDDERDFTRVHWDLRPNYRFRTLEVRIADQPTDVRRSAALAGSSRRSSPGNRGSDPGGATSIGTASSARPPRPDGSTPPSSNGSSGSCRTRRSCSPGRPRPNGSLRSASRTRSVTWQTGR